MKKVLRFIFLGQVISLSSLAQTPLCYLSQIVEADGDTISITYNAQNHITSLGKKSIVKTNEAGLIIEILHEAAVSSFSKATYKYDNNNNLIEYEQFGKSGKPDFITKFTYNTFHQLVEAQSAVAVGAGYFYGYRDFIYPNTTTKNPATIKSYSGDAKGKIGAPDEVITLTYDDKKTTGFLNPLDDLSPFATHNVISAYVVEVGQPPKTETFTYQYNAEGYPISKTEKEKGHSYTTHFHYSCK